MMDTEAIKKLGESLRFIAERWVEEFQERFPFALVKQMGDTIANLPELMQLSHVGDVDISTFRYKDGYIVTVDDENGALFTFRFGKKGRDKANKKHWALVRALKDHD